MNIAATLKQNKCGLLDLRNNAQAIVQDFDGDQVYFIFQDQSGIMLNSQGLTLLSQTKLKELRPKTESWVSSIIRS